MAPPPEGALCNLWFWLPPRFLFWGNRSLGSFLPFNGSRGRLNQLVLHANNTQGLEIVRRGKTAVPTKRRRPCGSPFSARRVMLFFGGLDGWDSFPQSSYLAMVDCSHSKHQGGVVNAERQHHEGGGPRSGCDPCSGPRSAGRRCRFSQRNTPS